MAVQSGWDIYYRPLRTTCFEGKHKSGSIGGIRVESEHWGGSIELTGCSADNALSLAIPVQQSDAYRSRGREVTAERVDIFASGCDLHAVMRPQTTLLACAISHEQLSSEEAFPFTPLQVDYRPEHVVHTPDPDAIAELRRWLLQLLGIMGRDALPGEAHHYLKEETLCRVAHALGTVDQNHAIRAGRNYSLAKSARDYMLDRKARPPTITEICLALGASERTLHATFKSQYGVSPKHFLKTQRLYTAHQRLKAAQASDHVTDIAMRLGFWEMGRFASDYRDMFGELPSVTLRNK